MLRLVGLTSVVVLAITVTIHSQSSATISLQERVTVVSQIYGRIASDAIGGYNPSDLAHVSFWSCWRGHISGDLIQTAHLSVDQSNTAFCVPQLAAKSLLRHSNVQTTQQFYIKSVPADALRAVEKMDALFQKSANSTPN